jgi:hypothetical protein
VELGTSGVLDAIEQQILRFAQDDIMVRATSSMVVLGELETLKPETLKRETPFNPWT